MRNRAATTSIHVGWAIILTVGIVIFWNLIGSARPVLQLSENQSLYIYSSAAQVIAGIYGLTVAGYAFLRNQQDRQIDKDESLAEIFQRIQMQQHAGVLFITCISGLAIFGSLLAIAFREVDTSFIRTAAGNTASALFVASLVWTAYFVADALRPEKILNASEAIKQEIESSAVAPQPPPDEQDEPKIIRSNLERFLISYNAIERHLEEYANHHFYMYEKQKLMSDMVSTLTNIASIQMPRSRWTKARIIKALASQQIIAKSFADELLILVRYRNALVHGRDMIVEEPMVARVELARKVLELKLPIRKSEDVDTLQELNIFSGG